MNLVENGDGKIYDKIIKNKINDFSVYGDF